MSKKRANGEGSIRKRKDGRWEGRYTAGYDKDGKVITKNVLGKTQAEVKEKLKTAIEESQKLDPTRTGQYTVQTWVTLWYEVFIKPQIRPNTKQFYRNCMENHLFPALGDCPLEKLSTIQIQRAINEMSEHGRNHYYSHIPLKETTLSPRIVQGVLGILRKSLDQAVAEKLILSNPAANCKAPKTVRKEMKVLPEELIGPYLHEAKQRGVFAPLYPDGFTCTMTCDQNQQRLDTAEMVQAQLAQIGITMEIASVERGAFIDKVIAGELEMFGLGWTADTGDPDYALFASFHSSMHGEGGNMSFYSNPEVDELLELGRSSTDPDVRKDAYYKVQEIVWDEVPCIFLQCPEDLYAYNSSLKNFATNADGRIKFAQLSWN